MPCASSSVTNLKQRRAARSHRHRQRQPGPQKKGYLPGPRYRCLASGLGLRTMYRGLLAASLLCCKEAQNSCASPASYCCTTIISGWTTCEIYLLQKHGVFPPQPSPEHATQPTDLQQQRWTWKTSHQCTRVRAPTKHGDHVEFDYVLQ